ncbi:MAG: hypothetical protein OH354_04675 [Candidatus Parvarchaeota archaeon]|nr:hypothetical protein [Candidatus Jingweiarchaeum tengchongense]
MYEKIRKQLERLDKKIRKCHKCDNREQFPNKLPTIQFKSFYSILFVDRGPAKRG